MRIQVEKSGDWFYGRVYTADKQNYTWGLTTCRAPSAKIALAMSNIQAKRLGITKVIPYEGPDPVHPELKRQRDEVRRWKKKTTDRK